MHKRTGSLRVAGWIALLTGAAAMAGAILTDGTVIDLVGAYGLLLVLAGGWAVIGAHLLERRERLAAERQAGDSSQPIPRHTSVLGG